MWRGGERSEPESGDLIMSVISRATTGKTLTLSGLVLAHHSMTGVM